MSKVSPRQAYNATIELAFDYNGTREKIPSERIVYVLIESDYENEVLPIIYVTLAVDSKLYTNIIKYKQSAKFYMSIKKVNKNSTLSISKEILSGSFSYIPSANNPNYTEELISDTDGNSYRRIMIGLVSIELTNKLRKSFNSIENETDTETLIAMALDGTNCIVEKPAYNDYYKSILIPPIASRYRLLEFIFNRNAFYDTMFRYFMDFKRSYLTSKKGDAIDAGDGSLTSIIIDIRSVTEDEAYYEGVEIKNDAYYVYINPSNSNVILNEGTEKVANQLVAVDEDVPVQFMDLEINKTEGSEEKMVFIRSDNAALVKNELETNTIIVEVLKQNIDGSIFTPDKCITVNNYGEYSRYNGKYLMIYKREFFKCVAGEFIMSCNVGLKRVNNIEPSNRVVATRKNYAPASNSSKTTTANKKNTSRPVQK